MMKIKLINKKDVKEIEIDEDTAVEDLLKSEGIAVETVVVRINGDTVTEDEIISDGDEVEVIKVIYGG